MSILSDLTDVVKAFSKKYKWSEEETVENFIEILDALDRRSLGVYPLTSEGDIDWALLNEMERDEVRRMLK